MKKRSACRASRMWLFGIAILSASFVSASSGYAADSKELKGWGKDSPYNQLYNPEKYGSFKGTLERIMEVVPLPGMAPGTALLVRRKNGDLVTVHLGPKSFVDVSVIGLQEGDKVKCLGVWATVGGKEVFIASKIKKGEFVQVKLRRTKDGLPFWVMNMDELAAFTAEFGPLVEHDEKTGLPRFYTREPTQPMPRGRSMELMGDKPLGDKAF